MPSSAAKSHDTGSVTSKDGTTIGYRQMGHGPGLVLVHGGMQAAQNFMKLGAALADSFTVYVPDRRGRGLSGPPGDNYGLKAECEDLDALLQKAGAHNVFGLSSGALISLQAALVLPAIGKVALYEPPLSVNHSTPTDWLARYDREVAQGRLGSAMVTAIRGTKTAPPLLRFVPRFVLDWPLNRAARLGAEDGDEGRKGNSGGRLPARRAALRLALWPLRRAATRHGTHDHGPANPADVPIKALVATMHYDVLLVRESESRLEDFRSVPAKVLLLGGSKSPRYLKETLDALEKVLPHEERVEFQGVGHVAADNNGQPELVAAELRSFFAEGAAPARG
jgi:pimeloyl-ACP methyl ester carboxylesterase